jgi:repressor LexA
MIGQNIRYLRKRAGISQKQIAEKLGVTQGSVSQWENEATEPDTRTIGQLAKVFSVPVDFFFSDEPRRELDSIRIMRNAVPIVGEIACGTPVTAEQNIEGYADVPDGVHADFALRCKGDSMEPTFMHGDLVLIRQTPDFQPGQIAAVGIEGEALLKHVYQQGENVICVSENPAYAPQSFHASEVTIYGIAVGYTRMFI